MALPIEHTDLTRSRATIVQEYFWYLRRSDPEPRSYAQELSLSLDGPLDRAAFTHATEAVIARHTVFRTRFEEVHGTLHQFIDRAPRFELEFEDRTSLPEAERAGDVSRVAAELASGIDLAAGPTLRGRLLAFAPDAHALVLMIDHSIADATSLVMLQREILRRYAKPDAADEPPAIQFLDYAEALDRLARSPVGAERRTWWRDHLHDAPRLALSTDFPRAEVDARRAAAPLGIISEPMHPVHTVEVPPPIRARITELATAEQTPASVVYRAAVVSLLAEAAGQTDLCIEDVFNPRGDHGIDQVQGAVATWTIMRFAVAGCATLRDVVARIKHVVAETSRQSLIPDYFEAVPLALRGATFNYMPAAWGNRTTKIGELSVNRYPGAFPRYKRHWELMFFVVDSTQRGLVNMTGNQRLWRAETIQRLAQRYLEILAT